MAKGPVQAAYDAVAARYADAMANELDARPIERALLDHVAKEAKAANGPLADLGCGPGHVTRFLAERGADVIGIDLSPAMIEIARTRFPKGRFRVGSTLALDDENASWGSAIALYSIIHMTADERALALREVARVLRPGGSFLVSFHVSSADHPTGDSIHLETWFDTSVDLTAYFLDPEDVARDLAAAGFDITLRLLRDPVVENEYQSRRCYFLVRRQ